MLSDDRDPVDVLAEEFADRLRRGEHPSVGDYAAAHPEHAEQLRDLLPAVAQMEMLKRFRSPAAEPSLPDRLGDFRIVRELGRGGMGVVFEAVQESLGRRVALKVLARHAQLDSTRRERFVREAQAAAKLHHTNIVPVFGVGEQDGLPYYVMQLIPGCGLHAVVWQWRKQTGKESAAEDETRAKAPGTKPDGESGRDEPEAAEVRAPAYGDWRFVADVGLQAAHALHYAHRQGVLHRDVKPANLILDGETVWVTDFGLAKLLNADGLTATGDILGTLQYIPPECLTGDADARSDVYGLGATLYELLTLEPPYAADSPARLIKQVADSDPPHPRELNPHVPLDLETIVLKAMAREPAARYATAGELAEDLQAFLEDRPIKARRTTLVSRGWRWCRRNPALASLAASTLVALTLAAVAGWVGYARTTAALAREADRRADAEREQEKALLAKRDADAARAEVQQKSEQLEANLKLSLDTFSKVFEAAGGSNRQGFGIPLPMMGPRPGGPGGPGNLVFGGGPGGPGGPPGGPPGPSPGGAPVVVMGGPAIGDTSDKAAILEAVLTFYDEFARKKTPNPDIQFEAAKASRRVCEAQLWLNRPDNAKAAGRRAVALLEPLVEKNPGKAEWRRELAMAYAAVPPEAFPDDFGKPLRRINELAADNPWLVATAQLRLGLAHEKAGSLPGAEAAYRAAAASFVAVEPAKRPNPGHLEPAFARLKLAGVLADQGKLPAARAVLEESVAALRLVVDQPGERGFGPERGWLGHTYRELAKVLKALGEVREAELAERNANQYSGFGFPGGPKKDGSFGKKDGPPPKKDGPPEG